MTIRTCLAALAGVACLVASAAFVASAQTDQSAEPDDHEAALSEEMAVALAETLAAVAAAERRRLGEWRMYGGWTQNQTGYSGGDSTGAWLYHTGTGEVRIVISPGPNACNRDDLEQAAFGCAGEVPSVVIRG